LSVPMNIVLVRLSCKYVSRDALRQMVPYRLWKRAHNIESRALHQFKNCYFSPIQCVLMERRRR
uniref:Ovule protein n=1 Tax=Heligmosomoides polygyrus TaxID=6339 RepID=A0A183FW64_HELPZ